MADRKSTPQLEIGAQSGKYPKVRRTLFAFAPTVFRELVKRGRDTSEPLPGARASQPVRRID